MAEAPKQAGPAKSSVPRDGGCRCSCERCAGCHIGTNIVTDRLLLAWTAAEGVVALSERVTQNLLVNRIAVDDARARVSSVAS